MFNLIQVEHGQKVSVDYSRDAFLTRFGHATLEDRYLLPGETPQDMFARVASTYADDPGHAQRLYDYISNLWFMPATPVLSNGGANRGLPISCFLNECSDSLDGIVNLWNENVWLAALGGGIGSYWGNLRSIGEPVGRNGKTSGIVPFIRVQDSLTLAISQGSLRRGSAACYLPVWHPEIEEFIEMRRPTGGDANRKALNLHHGVVITDAFMRAVEADEEWALCSPKDKTVITRVNARSLWIRLLTARIGTSQSITKWPGSKLKCRTSAAKSRCRPAKIKMVIIAPQCAACRRSISKNSLNGKIIRPLSKIACAFSTIFSTISSSARRTV
jgi:ribonucleoside-diphosphate reductase alpha chain